MKTLCILSDTHGNTAVYEKIRELLDSCDYIFHLGDVVGDAEQLARRYGSQKVFCVRGNCDYALKENTLYQEIEGVKLMFTHGHAYGVKTSLLSLEEKAREMGVSAAFYGHTHIPEIRDVGNLQLICPGTLKANAFQMTYCYAVISKGKVMAAILKA